MPSIGPQLPPHLSKRKRTPQDDGHSDSDDALGSPLRPPPPGKLPRSEGATPFANADEVDLGDDSDDAGPSPQQAPATAPARPARGPAPRASPRPVPDDSRPDSDCASDSDSDSYGPSLPFASAQRAPAIGPAPPTADDAAPQRDSWMLAPPSAAGGYSERDPTRIRARKFASKPSAAAPPPGAPSVWTETPEEKLRRLQNAVLGRSEPEAAGAAANGSSGARSDRDEERDRKIAASIEAQRGGSLYDEHSQKRRHGRVQKGEEDDDPSQRPFDRDKDLALGGKIGTAKRRELVNRAADFGGRFQKGSYL